MLQSASNVRKCAQSASNVRVKDNMSVAPVEFVKRLQLSAELGVHQLSSIALSAALVSSSLLLLCPSATAHVAIDRLPQQQSSAQQTFAAGFDPDAAVRGRVSNSRDMQRGSFVSGSNRVSRKNSSVAGAAADALQQLAAAQAAAAAGEYAAALSAYDHVVKNHPDLALSEYARLGRAIMLYQAGEVSNALLALEDQEVAMRGYPEVHAALAAVLYAERPVQRLRAEQQFDIALEFDSRYQDASWVAANKHWPPALMAALNRFLLLQQ